MMKAGVFFALMVAASASSLTLDTSDEAWKERPIAKVVRLLNDMQKQLEKEAEDDEDAYEKMVCWCETNDKEKSKAVTLAGQRITQLGSDIESYGAKATQLTTDIETLKEQVTELDQSLDKATEVRDKELAQFNAEEKDMIQSITSLKGAVVTLGSANSAIQTESLLQVRSLLQHKANKYKHILARQGMHISLLQQKTSTRSSAPASGEIFGMLKQMKESFETNLAESKKEEEQGATEYGQLKEAKTKEIAAGKSQTETKEVELADAQEKGAQSSQDLKDTNAQLAADEEFLADMRPKCAAADKNYEARVKARTAEIQAVSETIGILTSDEANDAFTKSMNFVQRTMTTKRVSSRREQASKMLKEASKKFKSVQLLKLASSVRLDAFGAVIEEIGATVNALKQEQKDEVKDKDFCVSELNQNERETNKYTDQKNNLEQKIADLTAQTADLGEAIAALKQEITDTQVGIMKAGEVRKADNADFNEVVADQRATQAILKKALDRLKQTYAFIQDNQPEQMTHSQNAGGGGAVAMIEEIVTESKDLEQKALGDEQSSQAAYEGFVKDGNKAITAATEDIANKADFKAKADVALAEATGDRKSTVDTLLKLGEMSAEIHSQCDFLLKNFEARQAARTEEMDALNQAKSIFSSMK